MKNLDSAKLEGENGEQSEEVPAMKDGICPKCKSSEVYHGPTGEVATGWSFNSASFIPMTMWHGAGLTNYVCTECGYVERYVVTLSDRATIAAKWEKVGS